MASNNILRVALVGAGPSACFAVEALVQGRPSIEIDVIERLPVPFGLARFGVAPDHLQTRRISEALERTLNAPAVRLFTGVDIGADISVAALRENYDAVILATGAALDSGLDIPGAQLRSVHGAGRFVGWYNGHPDHREISLSDIGTIAIIGHGNVALDIARVLAKCRAELESTDIDPDALAAICASPLRDIYLIGRRGPAEAKFTNVELRELATLAEARIEIDPRDLADQCDAPSSLSRLQQRNLATFRELARAEKAADARRRIHFLLNSRPIGISGERSVAGLTLMQGHETRQIGCEAVVTATGFRPAILPGLPVTDRGLLHHDDGRIDERLYAVGWLKRGASGVIGSNKPDAYATAKRVLMEVTPDSRRTGRQWLTTAIRRPNGAAVSG